MVIAKRIGKNLFFKIIGEMGTRILALIFYIIVARKLGSFDFGRFSFAYSFCSLFIVLVDIGINTIIIRELARRKEEVKTYLANITLLKIFLSVLTLFIIHFVIVMFGYPKDVVVICDLMALVVVGTGILEYINAVFNAFEKMEYEAILGVTNKIFFLIFGVGALIAGFSLKGLINGLILSYFVTILIGFYFIQTKITKIYLNFDFKFYREMFKSSIPVFIFFSFLVFYKHLDVVLLSLFKRPEAEIGWYSSVVKLTDALRVVPVLIIGSVFPILSRLFIESRNEFTIAISYLVKFLCVVSIPMAFGTYALSWKIINLIYGEQYISAATILAISIWAFVFIFLNHALIQILVIIDKHRYNIISCGTALIVNIVLNITLIPKFGYIGPAFALLGTEIILFFLSLYFMSIFLIPISFKSWLWKVSLSSVVMGLILLWFNHLNIFVLLFIGIFLYSILVLSFKILLPEDIKFLKSAVRIGK